jgi:Cu/Ag efflux pump CusA
LSRKIVTRLTVAEVQKPLANMVIGKLNSATLLTPFVLPALYACLSRAMSSISCGGRAEDDATLQ